MPDTALLEDLFRAYYTARQNKRNTINQLKFELNFEHEIFNLHDEIKARTYRPKREIAFIINRPVKREIFAADFRDRVIHHLLFGYISSIIEKYLIYDCYSCRRGKGTSAGIQRAGKFLRACSDNYTKNCFIMKMDISGYFMSINRGILYHKVSDLLTKEYRRCALSARAVPFDPEVVDFLIQRTLFRNPVDNCMLKGSRSDWAGLPANKSLFHASEGCGLPIGNLTSQLFGNVYLNDFDHWMKKKMGFRYYGRYVDDFYVMCRDRERLLDALPKIANYLKEKEALILHPDKTRINDCGEGLLFLGVVIKPYRRYIANRTKSNFYQKIQYWNDRLSIDGDRFGEEEQHQFISSMNSYLGVMRHYHTVKLRRKMLRDCLSRRFWKHFYVSGNFEKMGMN